MITKPLLIEIGVEELPAIPFLKELPKIKEKWQTILQEKRVETPFEFFYTPRRLILWHESFPLQQTDSTLELYGAPVEIAFKNGEPTPAAIGFAKKCGVEVEALDRRQKAGKEVLYYEKVERGVESQTILEEMLAQFLSSLQFGKSMRWGNCKESFIRPIRWIGVLLGETPVDITLFGVKSAPMSYPHRSISYEPFSYRTPEEYFKQIEANGVTIDPEKRRQQILAEIDAIENESRCSVDIDTDLLEEVVAITEHPKALMGKFEEHFLTLPPEVIILSMKEHQRYFPVFKGAKLENAFVVVADAICKDYSQIIDGNEKVLRPRLSDALFFYQNDLKRGLSNEGLKEITFIHGGGTLYEKIVREKIVAHFLADRFDTAIDRQKLDRALDLAKADLLTDMVYEFTELQGLMGYYYAKAMGEDDSVAVAIKEQYLPTGEHSELPSEKLSALVAMSIKIDTLLTIFALGKIPTGTKDPFALRRAVIGIIKIALNESFHLDIQKDMHTLIQDHYSQCDAKLIDTFIIERINQYFKVNPSLIHAVLQSGERDIVEISAKIEALDTMMKQSDFKSLSTTFKRVANIIKDMDLSAKPIDTTLFVQDEERALYDAYQQINATKFESYEAKLAALFGLKSVIDAFFDGVMVNVDDEKLKANRKNLIHAIYLNFREIADIKEITV